MDKTTVDILNEIVSEIKLVNGWGNYTIPISIINNKINSLKIEANNRKSIDNKKSKSCV